MSPGGRLFHKYLVLITALVVGALLVSGLSAAYFAHQQNKRSLAGLQREKALAAASRIEQFVKEIERQIAWTALPLLVTGEAALEQRRLDYLKSLRQAPAITDLAQLDRAGREQLRVSRLAMDVRRSGDDFSSSPAFRAAKPGKPYFGPVYFRKETEPYMTIATAWSGEEPGVTVAEVNLKFIWEVVSQIKIGEKGYAYVVDRGGQLIAHPDISRVLQKTNLSDLPHVRAARNSSAVSGHGEALVAEDQGGNKVLTAFAAIAPLSWWVFVEQPLTEAYAPLYSFMARTGLLLALGLALSVVASFFLARQMTRPVRELGAGAEKIGAGELSHRIDVQTGDELQSLAQQFNSMAEQLEESYASLERKVEERTRELAIANQHKSEFLANMSHELRTPLNAIIGFSEVLDQRLFGELNPKQAEYVKDINASGQHLLSLINDILDLSKIEAGRMELQVSEFSLPAALDNALTLVRERASRRGVRLALELTNGVGNVSADERKVKQILLNLLANAIKFTPEGGKVSVSAKQNGNAVEIAIEDTGIGIAPEHHELIFEEFRQFGAESGQKREGTGLGLALARKFVELHSGRMWVESAPGKGATFTFTIPVQHG